MTDHLPAAEPFLQVRVRCQKSFEWQISEVQRLEELAFCLKIVQTSSGVFKNCDYLITQCHPHALFSEQEHA